MLKSFLFTATILTALTPAAEAVVDGVNNSPSNTKKTVFSDVVPNIHGTNDTKKLNQALPKNSDKKISSISDISLTYNTIS